MLFDPSLDQTSGALLDPPSIPPVIRFPWSETTARLDAILAEPPSDGPDEGMAEVAYGDVLPTMAVTAYQCRPEAELSLAHELAPDIRVNGVAPDGTLGTDLRGLRALGSDQRSLGTDPGRGRAVAARSPLGVALDADDQAESFVFLASDAASGMTAKFLHPDGGAGIA